MRAEVWLALACAVVSVAAVLGVSTYLRQTEGIEPTGAQLTMATGLAVLQSLAILLRRLHPTGCLAAVAALQVVVVAVLPGGLDIQGVAFLVAAYTVGSLLPLRRALLSIVAIALVQTLAVAVLLAVDDSRGVSPALAYGVGALVDYLAPVLLGAFVATRRKYAEMAASRAEEELVAERARADRAVRDERSRMAREVHDVAAHHLSGMVVQAGALERLIDTDPAAAKSATRELRVQGRQTLNNLRTAVGILREQGSAPGDSSHDLEDGGAPVPGMAALGGLVDAAADAAVDMAETGRRWALSPIADVTAYRVVQEALSNARQHAAGAPVRVRLSWQEHAVSVQIENDAPPAWRGPPARLPVTPQPRPARQGLGLLGMRERADLVGGRLQAGPTPSGGWRVRLKLPRTPDAPTDRVVHTPEAHTEAGQ